MKVICTRGGLLLAKLRLVRKNYWNNNILCLMIVLVIVARVIAMMSPGDSWVARWQRIGMLGATVGHHYIPYMY